MFIKSSFYDMSCETYLLRLNSQARGYCPWTYHKQSNEGKKFINIILSFHQSNNAPWDINRTPNQVCASFSYCCCWLKMIYDEASIIKLHNYWWNSKVGFDVPFCLEATQYIMKGFYLSLKLYIKKFIIRYVLPTLQFFTCVHIFS